ncbi:GNAT family N-acetyltransferase [Acetobacter sicerae]|uniref:GNAT family N-acetyltransferase n=1 Tax=Acetobacter sicerae TaxID=85325 RepID=A0ABS8VW53_9PROT|nr:GNAT family N-acetyltransferase [Acetobacter tropicalis]MCE0743889.1 GNAT family N-acetyltransferase [Acetobacter sicerae]
MVHSAGRLVGYRFVYFPRDRAFNLARGRLANNELAYVAHLDTTCFVPEWRGKGLGKFLAHTALSEVQKLGLHHVFATVAPNNIASMRAMFASGLEIIDFDPDFKGKERYIFYRRLGGDALEPGDVKGAMNLHPSNTRDMHACLKSGFKAIGLRKCEAGWTFELIGS